MRIDNKDIVRMAQKLRDEENRQLNVSPVFQHPRPRASHYSLFTKAAIPAAAVIGFLLGLWTNSHLRTVETGLTALVDTVYVTVNETAATVDTALSAPQPLSLPAPRHIKKSRSTRKDTAAAIGLPMMSDRIRYDLLVKN